MHHLDFSAIMKNDEGDYTNRRGLHTTFTFFCILFVMVEHLECNITRNRISDPYPWQASLHYQTGSEERKRICSAVLISDDAAITAAHCIHNKLRKNLTVTLCKSSIHIVIKRTKKFDYYHASHTNDIAILLLRKKGIPPGEQRPIKFDHEDLDIEYGDKAYFKSYKDSKNGTIELQEISNCPIRCAGECVKHLPFCGIVKSSKLSKGDSGGVIWINNIGEELAIGITSYAVDKDDVCLSEDCSFIFTKLKHYNITGNINH